jgi:YegS/Rv2252/BmrU family lipid kinase
MKITIIANPAAGRGGAADVAHRAARSLQEKGCLTTLLLTQWTAAGDEKSAVYLAREYGTQADRVVVIGGDGTLREVVTGLAEIERRIPVALVPLGNANVIAREFGIPLDIDSSIELLNGECTLDVDAGSVNDDLFLAMIGVGYDAWVTRIVDWIRNTRLGARIYGWRKGADFLYVIAGLLVALRLVPRRYSLSVDSEKEARTFPTIWVSNTQTYAKGWSIAPTADPCDGVLDYHASRAAGVIRPFLNLYRASRCQPSPGWISTYGTAERLRIQAETPFHWQLDGDPRPPDRSLNIEIRPGFFLLVVPEPASTQRRQ